MTKNSINLLKAESAINGLGGDERSGWVLSPYYSFRGYFGNATCGISRQYQQVFDVHMETGSRRAGIPGFVKAAERRREPGRIRFEYRVMGRSMLICHHVRGRRFRYARKSMPGSQECRAHACRCVLCCAQIDTFGKCAIIGKARLVQPASGNCFSSWEGASPLAHRGAHVPGLHPGVCSSRWEDYDGTDRLS